MTEVVKKYAGFCALCVLQVVILGVGCTQPDANIGSPAPVELVAPNSNQVDHIPEPGDNYSHVSIENWNAYTVAGSVPFMKIEGPNGFEAIVDGGGDPRPVDFSPDHKVLVYLDSSPIGWDSFYAIELKEGAMPRLLTNNTLSEVPLLDRVNEAIPTPPNGVVEWMSSSTFRFGHPYRGEISINIDSGEVTVNGKPVR